MIESSAAKICTNCGTAKPLADFHKDAKAKDGKASWCKCCANKDKRTNRKRTYCKVKKREWQVKTRYGISIEAVQQMHLAQGGKCVLCDIELANKRPCIDHCHNTGKVRGLLCHRCNIRLGGWDDLAWRTRAMAYLGINEQKEGEA